MKEVYTIHEYFADNTRKYKKTGIYLVCVFNIWQYEIVDHCNPNLSHDGILTGTKEWLHFQMLFDPLEEQLYLPSMLVYLCNCLREHFEIIGYKFILFLLFFIKECDNSEIMSKFIHLWIRRKSNELIFSYSKSLTFSHKFTILCHKNICIFLGSRYKEYTLFIKGVEPIVIDVSTIERENASRRQSKAFSFLCLSHFMYLSFCHADHLWYIASVIEKNMNLTGSFCCSVFCPREYWQTEIDDGCIKRIERILKRKFPVWIWSKSCNTLNFRKKSIEELLIYFIGSIIVCVREGWSCYCLYSEVIPFIFMKWESCLNISETLFSCSLWKEKYLKLIPWGKLLGISISIMLSDKLIELGFWKELHYLRKYRTDMMFWSTRRHRKSILTK